MYKSPIEVIMHDLPAKIVKDEENMVLLEVRKQISVDVDEYELKKALAYDRNQYEKGFEDARMKFERPHGEWIEDSGDNDVRCSHCGLAIGALNKSNHEMLNALTGGKWWTHYRYCPMCGSINGGEAE